jgi:precorrin-6B methylase 2
LTQNALPVPSEDVATQLVAAMQAHRLGDACAAICAAPEGTYSPSDIALAYDGAKACQTIHAEVEEVAGHLAHQMAALGLASPEYAPQVPAPQFHFLTMRLPAADVAGAVTAAAAEGFIVDPILIDRMDQIVRTGTSLQLMAWDPFPMRLTLVWKEPKGIARRLHDLRPEPADIAVIKLPGLLSAGYFAIKPFRQISEKLRGAHVADTKGLRAGSAGLGTPRALIAPLLSLLDVGADDLVCDVGCGDGRVLIQAAEQFGCQGLGIERNRGLLRTAHAAVEARGLTDQITLQPSDAKTAQIGAASVVFLFLPAKLLPGILARVRSRARPGTRIVAHEQVPLPVSPPADARVPLIGANAMTVAHIWHV